MPAAPFLPPFLEELRRLGHETTVFFPKLSDSAPESEAEVPVEWTASPRPLVDLSPSRPRDLVDICRLLLNWRSVVLGAQRTEPFDIVLALWAVPSGLVARSLGRRLRLPYAVWVLGSDVNKYGRSRLFRPLLAAILGRAGAVFANSNRLREAVEELSGAKAQLLRTARPLPVSRRMEARAEDLFLFIGRLEPVKGIDVLVEAAKSLAAEEREWGLVIVGDGSLRESLERECASDGRLRSRVRFAGYQEGEELADAIARSACIVIPSRSESMPVVVAEGLQAGKRFIVTDVGDMPDVVTKYGLGEVVPSEDPVALAAAMRDFVSHGPRRPSLNPAAAAEFDVGRSAARFSETCEEIVSTGVSGEPVPSSRLGGRRLLTLTKAGSWLLSGVILLFLARSLYANWAKLDISLADVSLGWLAASASVFLVAFALSALIWQRSLRVFDARPGYLACLRTIILSQLAKYLPGGFWAVVGQVELSKRAGVRRSTALVATGMMSVAVVFSGLVFGLLAGAPSLPIGRGRTLWLVGGLAAMLLFMHPAVFTRVWRLTFRLMKKEVPSFTLTWKDTAKVFLTALLYWPVAGFGFYLMSLGLVPLSPSLIVPLMAVYALSWTAGYVVIFAPGGLGVREGLMTLLLTGLVGLPAAALISLFQRVWLTLLELLFAALWNVGRLPLPNQEAEQE